MRSQSHPAVTTDLSLAQIVADLAAHGCRAGRQRWRLQSDTDRAASGGRLARLVRDGAHVVELQEAPRIGEHDLGWAPQQRCDQHVHPARDLRITELCDRVLGKRHHRLLVDALYLRREACLLEPGRVHLSVMYIVRTYLA